MNHLSNEQDCKLFNELSVSAQNSMFLEHGRSQDIDLETKEFKDWCQHWQDILQKNLQEQLSKDLLLLALIYPCAISLSIWVNFVIAIFFTKDK